MDCCDKHCDKSFCFDKSIVLYVIAIILFILTFTPLFSRFNSYVYLFVILLAGYDLIIDGIKNIFKLNFHESTLMTIAIVCAFILGEFPESCMIVLLYKLGEFVEDRAVDISNQNINKIAKIKSNTANLLLDNKDIEVKNVEDIKVLDKILVKPGEMIPLDCKVLSGTSTLDTSNITGESFPVNVKKNDLLLSGCINLDGSITCIVTKDFKNSTASQIVDLVYEAKNNKGNTEKFITKFSKIYTPLVILVAFLLVLIPFILGYELYPWIIKALTLLVASCPCSIIISIPLAFFSCIGKISKKGMLIKGTKHIENLAIANTIAFDKTGTITTGKLEIKDFVIFNDFPKNMVISYMYNLERNSNHPVSSAIYKLAEESSITQIVDVNDYKEVSGHGVYGIIDNNSVLFGNVKLLDMYNISYNFSDDNGIYLYINNVLAASVTLKESIRQNADKLIKDLKGLNVNNIAILTGDNHTNANYIAENINVTNVYSNLLPDDKLKIVNDLKKNGKVIFVGDGINDAPVLAASDFGISMGQGTEIANDISDGILISNNISTIPGIIKVARKCMGIVKFNIVFSLSIKLIVFILALMSIAPIWLAIVADTGVTLLTVLNSIRIFKST